MIVEFSDGAHLGDRLLLERYVSPSSWCNYLLIEVKVTMHLHYTVLLMVARHASGNEFFKMLRLSLHYFGCTLAPIILFERYPFLLL